MSNVLILILSVILLFSILINVFFLWYLSNLTKKLMFFSENLNDLLDIIENFTSHIKSVYELETFYGDITLHNLMQHGESVVQQLEKFEDIIYLTEEDIEEDDVNGQEPEPTPEDSAEEKKIPAQIRFQI